MLTDKMIFPKLDHIEKEYMALRFEKVADVAMQLCETKEYLRREPSGSKAKWSKVAPGARWGGDWVTGWFKGDITLPAACRGKRVFVRAKTGGAEALFIVDEEYRGVFDDNHPVVMMTSKGAPKKYHLAFESYSGHTYPGTQPYEKPGNTGHASHVFDGIEIMLEREDVTAFAFDFMALRQLAATLDDNNLRKFKVLNCLVKVFRLVDAMPTEFPESHWRPLLTEARKIMKPLLESKNGPTTPWFAINGHSHIDTAWLWPLEETERKCARTFSSILSLMEQYPEFRFIQSSPAQTVMVEKLYPSILKGMRKRVAEGRWEPNGAMWVEPDLNVPSGESLARQLLMGQSATRRLFNYTADVLWMPDVFGFSAALPQLCKLANVDFFCTHKLAWNDTNRFPHDTFTWKGIDGSKVIVHFNTFHCWPDPQTLIGAWNGVIHKDIQDRRLMDYGFGDGGGGPQNEMIEIARRTTDLEGCPRTKDMSISEFLQGVRTDLKDIPEWAGELYLECHRGTLTSISEIKRLNRKTEFALRDAELACTLGALKGPKYKYPAEPLDAIWKRHLTNQFHDILPGSSIAKVNDAAIQTFKDCIAEAKELTQSALSAIAKTSRTGKHLNVLNTLSWDRANEVVLSDVPAGLMPADETLTAQRVVDVEGNESLAVQGISLPSLAITSIPLAKRVPAASTSAASASPFKVGKTSVETPFAVVKFDKSGRITSWLDKQSKREIVKEGGSFNQLLIGQDVPDAWDNWNINYDLLGNLKPNTRLIGQSVVADGPLQLRLKLDYEMGQGTKLTQHVVFHAASPQVDFENLLDWHETHQFLKVGFDTNIHTDFARYETQFGYLERPTHQNTAMDRARFEFSVQKWADLSENDFGIALLNDCKYGMSGMGGSMQLSLLKSGTHPDPRGDAGLHRFTYSLLPHHGSFAVESVVRPAYELNTLPVTAVCAEPMEMGSFIQVDSSNVIIEAVKYAESGNGFVVRLYEAGKSATEANITLPASVKEVWSVNLLEDKQEELKIKGGKVTIRLHAFEIKTLSCLI